MSAVAAPRSSTRTRAGRRAPARVGVTSVLLIMACAIVLIGIVTLQVSVLRLNSERGDLQAKRDQIVERQQRAARAPGWQVRPRRAGRQGEPRRGSCSRRRDHRTGSLGRSRGRGRRAGEAVCAAPVRQRGFRLMLACVCVGIARAGRTRGAGADARRRALARAAEAQQRMKVGCGRRAVRCIDRRASRSRSPPGRHRRGSGRARRATGRRFAQALSTYTRTRPPDREAHGRERTVRLRRAAPSSTRRSDAHQGDPMLGPLVKSRAIEPSRSPPHLPTAASPPRIIGVSGDGSPASSARATTCSARATAWPGLEGQRPTDGRLALGARPARARAGAGQVVQLALRRAHPAARAAEDRRTRANGTPRP